jgi:uridine phosphorylase
VSDEKNIPRSNAPILRDKDFAAPSMFTPESLLREARRQKRLSSLRVPDICILDPDGDIVRHLRTTDRAHHHPDWACYHTELYEFAPGDTKYGIVGCAVGAAFAVLVAEELFASGCELLISVTSAGQLIELRPPPYFIVIESALRDEGTSYHYAAPAEYSVANAALVRAAKKALSAAGIAIEAGATWTTDAPFRETSHAIEAARSAGLLAVEMEAAALYAFATARSKAVLCFAHVTNQMGRIEGDFEKGLADGAEDALKLITAVADACRKMGTD